MNSRDKGKRGEREAAKYLRELGFEDAVRTQQYNGLGESDVICPMSLPNLHIEVKYGKSYQLGNAAWEDALFQADRDAKGKPWVVLWRENRQKWRLSYMQDDGTLATFIGNVDIAFILRSRANETGN